MPPLGTWAKELAMNSKATIKIIATTTHERLLFFNDFANVLKVKKVPAPTNKNEQNVIKRKPELFIAVP